MEDGSVPEVTGYYNNLTVACANTLGQSMAMSCKPEGTRVVCQPVEPHLCEAVTTYKASVCCEHCRDTDRTDQHRMTARGSCRAISVPDRHLILPSHGLLSCGPLLPNFVVMMSHCIVIIHD